MVLLGSLTGTLLGWLMGFLSLFLIMLILIQRGKGGGLTGALGGPGGQSAFGSKAGDTFTVITIVVASLWGFTCAMAMLLLGTGSVAPAVADDLSVTAGPGDEQTDLPNSLIIPPSGLGGPVDDAAGPGETPSMELTPAVPAGGAIDESAVEPSQSADPAESPADEPADETPADETPSDETPSDETTDNETTDNETTDNETTDNETSDN